jgi:DNA-directed RNA polymerase beta subunit
MVKNYRDLISAYYREHPWGDANITSYDEFLEKGLQKIVDEMGDVTPTIIPQEVESFVIRFKKIWVEKPSIVEADGSKRTITPLEARIRKLTYSAPIFLEVSAYVDDVQRESFTTVIGKVPVMIKSKYCHLNGMKKEELIAAGEDPTDPGGYFIVNGNERVMITVEDLASNRFFVEKMSTGVSAYAGRIFSETGTYRIPHVLEQMKDGIFYLTFTRFKRVPLLAIIKALGLIKDQDIAKAISDDEMFDSVVVNMYDIAEIKTQDDALEFLARKIGIPQAREIKIEKCKDQLDKYLLPHLGTSSDDRMSKAYNLCKVLKKFIIYSDGEVALPDKDHYENKRLKHSGDMLDALFKTQMRNLVQDVLYNFQRLVKRGKFNTIKIIIRDELLTSNIKSALATGTWTGGRKGISQNIDRTNALATQSHLDRVASLLSSTQENFDARALHSTHWGKICPIETPEGTPIGLRKNLALLCKSSQGEVQEDKLKKNLEGLGLELVE